MPSWPSIIKSKNAAADAGYATLLPSRHENDQLSPAGYEHRRTSTAISEALTSSSSEAEADIGDERVVRNIRDQSQPDGSSKNHASLGHGRRHEHARLASDEPFAKQQQQQQQQTKNGSPQKGRISFSSSADPSSKKANWSSKGRLSLDVFSLKSVSSKKASKKDENENDKAKVDAPEKEKKENVKVKTAKKEALQAQTVLELITGLNTIYLPQLPFGNGKDSSKKGTLPVKPPSKPLPQVSSKQIKRLKASLTDAREAPGIIKELKKIPTHDAAQENQEQPTHKTTKSAGSNVATDFKVRGVCLECSEIEFLVKKAGINDSSPFKDGHIPDVSVTPATTPQAEKQREASEVIPGTPFMFSAKMRVLSKAAEGAMPSPGKLLGQIASTTGTFDALAGVTGRLVEASGSHTGMVLPPDDRMSIFIYWWGYELVLPPASLATLGSAHSVAGTIFTFLQAMAMSGGAPEVAPFVRYLSFYMDMEWKAIIAQNKGKGVVLAATWVVPVAVVPRSYDFEH